MYFYTNGRLAWLKIAKNACSSWSHLFETLGWQRQDLFIPDQPLSQLEFFGFLREPDRRHTLGLAQYITNEKLESRLVDPFFQRLLVSAVFDEHTYTVHCMVPSEIIARTTWFIMDDHYDYEQLTRNWLARHNITLPPVPRINVSKPHMKQMQAQIDQFKQQYVSSHQTLAKNFLGADLRLYRTQLLNQHQWSNG